MREYYETGSWSPAALRSLFVSSLLTAFLAAAITCISLLMVDDWRYLSALWVALAVWLIGGVAYALAKVFLFMAIRRTRAWKAASASF